MSKTEEYIAKIRAALSDGKRGDKHALVGEVVSIFYDTIPGIKHGLDRYRSRASFPGSGSTVYDDDGDLNKLLGKLELRREAERRELLSDPVAAATAKIDTDIASCADAIEAASPEEQLRLIWNLVGMYEGVFPSIGYGLSSHDSGTDYPGDLLLVKGRLEVYRSQIVLEASKTSSSNISLTNTATANAESSVTVSLAQVSSQIQQLPNNVLCEDDKKELRIMLLDLEELRGKSKKDAHSRLKKILEWLSDKGVDVMIAALPYIAQFVQGLA